MTVNPLIAARVDNPESPSVGVWIADDIELIARGSHAQTWDNVASSLREESTELRRATGLDLTGWRGAASTAYQSWAAQRAQCRRALAEGAETPALMTEGAGVLIGAVRIMARDAIAAVVSRLIVYAIALIATLEVARNRDASRLASTPARRKARWVRVSDPGSMTGRLFTDKENVFLDSALSPSAIADWFAPLRGMEIRAGAQGEV